MTVQVTDDAHDYSGGARHGHLGVGKKLQNNAQSVDLSGASLFENLVQKLALERASTKHSYRALHLG